MDFDYILNDEKLADKPDEKKEKISKKLAKIMFTAWNLTHDVRGYLHPEVPEQMWQLFKTTYYQTSGRLLVDPKFQIEVHQLLQDLEITYFDTSFRNLVEPKLANYADQVGLSWN